MKKDIKGYVSFVLHAHLPFVHHPESDTYLEEQWLFEAYSETYIPLILNFQKLVDEKVDFKITMNISPPLLNMFDKMMYENIISDEVVISTGLDIYSRERGDTFQLVFERADKKMYARKKLLKDMKEKI